ncbi:MAG: exo-alpha-sialidase [Candidatus Brocadiia bacterium]
MESPITNAWDQGLARRKLEVEATFLFRPEHDDDWHYSHHPFLAHFAGAYYAMWSSGRRHEDDVGQRVMIARSRDFQTWSEPEVLMPTARGQYSDMVRYAEGWHQHDGTLVAYFTQYEYEPDALVDGHRPADSRQHMDTRLFGVTSTDGVSWGEPIDTGLRIGPNHGPEALASGRLLISGNFTYPYTDDRTGLTGWRMSGLYPEEMEGEIVDDSEAIWKMKEIQGWPNVLREGSWYQTDDDAVHMLLRSNTGRLWVTESTDDGVSWSAPLPTSFTNDSSKFHCGRLPDGRFYWVGNPDAASRHDRCPLALLLSSDGVRFDQHFILADESTLYEKRLDGMHKSGQYGYPHSVIYDGAFHVIVSREKEAVQVFRVSLKALG